MSEFHINGAKRLGGKCFVQGSKNASLPVLAASVISPCESYILNVPRLSDTTSALNILRHLGCTAVQSGNDIYIDSRSISANDIPQSLSLLMRSSILFMGAVLARCGEVRISAPGGCRLGKRPIDLHLKAMKALGAEVLEESGEILCRAGRLKGTKIVLPFPSVGATENAMLAASGAEGETVIIGAAKEPEIEDLQEYLRKLGVMIYGAGTDRIVISGKEPETCAGHRIGPDRMAASTLLCATAATGGEIELAGLDPKHFLSLLHFLNRAGCDIIPSTRSIYLASGGTLKAVDFVKTEPYPGFPTDAQPLLMAALMCSEGETRFEENIFENRFIHTDGLRKFGADITVSDKVATVRGVDRLTPAEVDATDLRGAAAMIIAALKAEGHSVISDTGHVERGYESFDRLLRSLGADIYMEN